MRSEYFEIEQPLYSRMKVKSKDTYIMFFSNHIGQFDSNGEIIDKTDTNMYNQNNLINLFIVRNIRFREPVLDLNVRNHLLQYSYFVFRIIDRDFLIYPLHLMMNYMYFLEKSLEKQIIIGPYENFSVMLSMTKEYGNDFQLTCELGGMMMKSI